MMFIDPFTSLIAYINSMNAITPELQLAIAHGIFNIVTTIVFFPFINKIVIVIQKIFPSRHHELQMDLSELDPNVVQLFPCHALAIAKNKIIEMGNLAVTMMKTIRMYFEDKNGTTKENIEELEGAINLLDKKITDYLLLISHEQLNDHDSNDYFANMKSIKDIERIGDICMNLAHFFEAIFDQKEDFSEEGKQDILTMLDMDIDTLQHSLQAFDQHDVDDVFIVGQRRIVIDVGIHLTVQTVNLRRRRIGSGGLPFLIRNAVHQALGPGIILYFVDISPNN